MTSAAVLLPQDYTNGTLEHVRLTMKNTKHLSQSLLKAKIKRVTFDPTLAKHRAAYLVFMRTGKWVMHFYNEWPHQSTVSTAQSKLLTHFLSTAANEAAAAKLLAKHSIGLKVVEEDQPLPQREEGLTENQRVDELVDMVELMKVA